MKKIYLLLISSLLILQAFSQDYYPMQPGNTWNLHKIDSNGMVIGFDSAKITLSSRTDLKVFDMLERTDEGDVEYQLYDNPDNPNEIYAILFSGFEAISMWKHKYKNGETWNSDEDIMISEYVGKVTVPAGTFDSCYVVRIIGTPGGWYFAPNIGIVKSVTEEGNIYALVSYNVSLSGPTGISFAKSSKVEVYPNPFNDKISLENMERVSKVEVFNASGNFVSQKSNLNFMDHIETSSLEEGIYFVKILFFDNSSLNYRLIKQ